MKGQKKKIDWDNDVIGFAVKNLRCTLQEAYDMSWAEFVIRSIGFKEQREYEMKMTREVAYQIYLGNHSFSKNKPKSKEKFWSIGEQKKPKINKVQEEAFRKAHKKYLSEVKKKQNG